MHLIHLVSFILVISVSFINAQSCETPKKENGECISLYECEPLVSLVRNKNRTPEDNKLLQSSHCGFIDKKTPKVCCPPKNELPKYDCATPNGQPGQCIGLYKCKHLADSLRGTNKNEQTIEYVRKSVCTGPEKYSVCCGPPPSDVDQTEPYYECSKSMNAFPPESSSGCCGLDSNSDSKIIGGKATGIDQYPWLVIIEYYLLGQLKLLCGGSLISGKYVLTAGHCVKGSILKEGNPRNVRLGEYNTTSNGPDCVSTAGNGWDCTKPVIIAPIEKTIPHPEYNPYHIQRRHDIALIRLRNTAPYTDFIRPICLPSVDYTQSPPPQFKLYAAGWGRYIQEKNIRKSSKVKMDVDLPYVPRDKCQAAQRTQRFGENLVLWNGQMCAGGELGKDSCRGDSGGPLMYNIERIYEIVGIVSFGPEICGQLNIPGVYTNVHEYLPWIRNTIEE